MKRRRPKRKKRVIIEDEYTMGETWAKKETDTYKGGKPPSPEKRMKEVTYVVMKSLDRPLGYRIMQELIQGA